MCQDDNSPVEVPFKLSEELDGGYLVTCAVLPELQSRGASPEEAFEKANTDMVAILNRYEAEGKPLPPHFC